jgi:prepilin-type processing-associated H-X9-DG protein
VGGFGSFHSGGANFLFGDGSVRFLAENISTAVYQQLGHRADKALPAYDF